MRREPIESINRDVSIDTSDALFPEFGQSACCINKLFGNVGRYDAIHANVFGFRFHASSDIDRIAIKRNVAPDIAFLAGADVRHTNIVFQIGRV